MTKRFSQNSLFLNESNSKHRLKVKSLMTLVEEHPYRENIEKTFGTEEIGEEFIIIDHVDTVYNRLLKILKENNRFNIQAARKDISLVEQIIEVEGIAGTPVKFVFDECVNEDGEIINDLEAFAIYDAKNMFLNQYEMAKYANHLYKGKQFELVRYNVEYFKNQAAEAKVPGKPRSYRLIENDGELFVRGITSVNQYNEYGVDFAFVVAMLTFHQMMKDFPGDNYAISSAALSASKIEVIVESKIMKEAEGFGKVSSSTVVSTNDLGNASFKFLNIVKVGIQESRGFYIIPDSKSDYNNELVIPHNTKADRVLAMVKDSKDVIHSTNNFIDELKKVKGIKTPDELRMQILLKLENSKTELKSMKNVKDLFSKSISNTIENFAKLLEMCRKAEELDIDYDLKDKLRYIISEIILNKKSKS